MACPVCFSTADTVMTSSVNTGIFVLLGVTVAVLAGFGTFIASLIRRARTAGRAPHEAAPLAPGPMVG